MRKEISDRLKHIRKAWGRTQVHMAERLNVSTRSYAAYERAEADIPTYSLDYYAGMGWNMHWIFTGTGPERIEDDRGNRLIDYVPVGSAPASQDLSEEQLIIALEITDDIIHTQNARYVPRTLYARLLRLMYQGVSQGLPVADVHDIGQKAVRAVISGARGKQDDGGIGLGGAGTGSGR